MRRYHESNLKTNSYHQQLPGTVNRYLQATFWATKSRFLLLMTGGQFPRCISFGYGLKYGNPGWVAQNVAWRYLLPKKHGSIVVWAINFKSDFRFYLRGCLEAVLASKHHFWEPLSEFWKFFPTKLKNMEGFLTKFIISFNFSKNRQKSPKNQILHFTPCQPQVY